jgi:Glycosyl-4,4'-diaponeurosporenoate acyltransferase
MYQNLREAAENSLSIFLAASLVPALLRIILHLSMAKHVPVVKDPSREPKEKKDLPVNHQPDKQKEFRKITRLAAVYNMIPNLIWSTLFLLPVTIFCYHYLIPKYVYLLLGVSLIPLFFPNSFFDLIQLSRKPSFYKRIGVKHINKFAQNGAFLIRYMRNKYPDFKTISINNSSIKKQFHQTYFFEKFHFSMFIFFGGVTIYAMIKVYLVWVFVFLICNLLYNIYPNLLQQYIRLRLSSSMRRTTPG